jgi:biotin carboxyl carrier protein
VTEPTWADVLELVRGFEAAGHTELQLERPGLRLHVSRATTADPANPSDGVAVPAPVPGIFHRRPAPGEPPFVEVGSEVAADTPVAIVEVMKLMTYVTAGTAGRITRVCVADGSLVDEGQQLFLVDPDDGFADPGEEWA